MTTLAALRAGCQRGEMPRYPEWIGVINQTRLADDSEVFAAVAVREYDPPYCLDALAALQQALWPGSRVEIRPAGMTGYVTDLRHQEMHILGYSKLCPTLATAWLDAILAGLEKEAGE